VWALTCAYRFTWEQLPTTGTELGVLGMAAHHLVDEHVDGDQLSQDPPGNAAGACNGRIQQHG
jgi:hypothetical protein